MQDLEMSTKYLRNVVDGPATMVMHEGVAARRVLRRCGELSELGFKAAKDSQIIPSHATAPMSLYYEAAAVLANSDNIGGSLKSRIFNKKDLKSTPGQIFALVAESSKWSVVLKDVIEKTKLLAEERKVSLD
jgi:hypothetical protein